MPKYYNTCTSELPSQLPQAHIYTSGQLPPVRYRRVQPNNRFPTKRQCCATKWWRNQSGPRHDAESIYLMYQFTQDTQHISLTFLPFSFEPTPIGHTFDTAVWPIKPISWRGGLHGRRGAKPKRRATTANKSTPPKFPYVKTSDADSELTRSRLVGTGHAPATVFLSFILDSIARPLNKHLCADLGQGLLQGRQYSCIKRNLVLPSQHHLPPRRNRCDAPCITLRCDTPSFHPIQSYRNARREYPLATSPISYHHFTPP